MYSYFSDFHDSSGLERFAGFDCFRENNQIQVEYD